MYCIERMAGDVEAEHLLLAGELLLDRSSPGRWAAACSVLLLGAEHHRRTARPGRSPGRAARAGPLSIARSTDGEQLRARALQRIHRAGLDQAFDHAPVDRGQVHLLAELVDAM